MCEGIPLPASQSVFGGEWWLVPSGRPVEPQTSSPLPSPQSSIQLYCTAHPLPGPVPSFLRPPSLSVTCLYNPISRTQSLVHPPRPHHPPWVRRPKGAHARLHPHIAISRTDVFTAAEKRASTEGLVDNVDPRESSEAQELPKYEQPAEPAPLPLKEKLITCFWIALNTFSTVGLIFLSKRYQWTLRQRVLRHANGSTVSSAMSSCTPASSWW